jgi:deoxycytidylate deaminase
MCVHAEANALNSVARFGVSVVGADLYTTDAPCMQCAKNLLQVGVQSVHYLRPFRVDDPAVDGGQDNLAAQHELMRKLSPSKYRQSNVGSMLAQFGQWIDSDSEHGFEVPLQRSALEDDQFPN